MRIGNGYDIHAEGIMIPPIKVVDRGKERPDILELIWNNVRWPEGVRIDNYALMAALKVCENRLVALLDKYGRDTVLECVKEMLDRMEENVRKLIVAPDFNLSSLRELIRKEGMVTMFEDGLRKVERGMTTVEEVFRVIRE